MAVSALRTEERISEIIGIGIQYNPETKPVLKNVPRLYKDQACNLSPDFTRHHQPLDISPKNASTSGSEPSESDGFPTLTCSSVYRAG